MTVELPPPQYDFDAPNAEVRHVDYWDVHETCVNMGLMMQNKKNVKNLGGGSRGRTSVKLNARASGCAQIVGYKCIIVLPTKDSVGARVYSRIYRHEMGHCNGWDYFHTDGRF